MALLWWEWKDSNKIVSGEKGNTGQEQDSCTLALEKGNTKVNLIRLITRTDDDFEQFCTREQVK
jgi:hypothetical protein